MPSSFFGGICGFQGCCLEISVRPQQSSGLLHCIFVPKIKTLQKEHIDKRLGWSRKVPPPKKNHALVIFDPQGVVLRVPNL